MIKKILFPIALILAIVVGGVGADFMRNKIGSPSGQFTTENTSKGHAKKTSHDAKSGEHGKVKKKKKKKKGHNTDEGDNGNSGQAVSYLKFKRQFVVPVMDNGKIKSLALLNINLELTQDAPQNVYSLEPKLRDAIMRELLALSHQGAFSANLTSTTTYDKVQKSLLKACHTVMKDGVRDVLILDLMRQDQ